MQTRLTRWLGCTAVAGLSAFTVMSGSAAGFFPPIPTGNGPPTVAPQVPRVPTVPTGVDANPPRPQPIVPISPPPFVPVSPKGIDPKPKVPPPHPCDCDDPRPPHCVPEPTTILTGLVGLSLVGIAAAKRKFGKKKTDDVS